MANVWPATQSQLYGELNKLAETGLIVVTQFGPRGRKEYAITDAGRAELQRWLTSPDDDPTFRSAQLLRVFLLDEVPREEARAYLESIRADADRERERYEKIRDSYDWSEDARAFFARAALEIGLRSSRMEAEWASWVIEQLGERQCRNVASR